MSLCVFGSDFPNSSVCDNLDSATYKYPIGIIAMNNYPVPEKFHSVFKKILPGVFLFNYWNYFFRLLEGVSEVVLLLFFSMLLQAATIDTEQIVAFDNSKAVAQSLYLRAWIPDGIVICRGVLFLLPGQGGDTRGFANVNGNIQMQVLAERHGFMLIGVKYSNGEGTDCFRLRTPASPYTKSENLGPYRVGKANAEVLIQGMHQFAQNLGRPELETVPMALWGFSNGSGLAVKVADYYPERVLAFAHNKGISYPQYSGIDVTVNPPSDKYWKPSLTNAYKVPGLITYGELDVSRAPAIKLAFQRDRASGALWGMIPDWGLEHDSNGYGHYFAAVFLDRMIEQRIPASWVPGASSQAPVLTPLKASTGWACDDATVESPLATMAPVVSLADPATALKCSWFANEELARCWQAIATHQSLVKLKVPPVLQAVTSGTTLATSLATSTNSFTAVSWFDGLAAMPTTSAAPWGSRLASTYGLHPVWAQLKGASGVDSVTNLGIVVTKRLANLAPAIVMAPAVDQSPVFALTDAPLSVTARDPDGGLESVLTYTWSTVSGPVPASFKGANGTNAGKNLTVWFPSAGLYVLRVVVSDLEGLTATVDLTVSVTSQVVGAPTIATAASAAVNPVTGTSVELSVLGADDGGEPALTYAWSVIGTPPAPVVFSANSSNEAKATTATFTKVGTYALQAVITDAGGLSVASTVTVVVNQVLTGITVAPATASVIIGQTLSLSAVGSDQFGTAMGMSPIWTVAGGGTITPTGLFTAAMSVGTSTITASAGGRSGTAVLMVTNVAPTVLVPAAASANPVIGTSVDLSVLGGDDGDVGALTYTWSLTGTSPAPVVFSVNANHAAQSTRATFTAAGMYAFEVVIADAGDLTVASQLYVVVAQTLTGLTVTPTTASVGPGQTATLGVRGSDQFGMAMSVVATWAVSGGGTISSDGEFTPEMGASGPFTVTANVGGKTATAVITVVNAPPTISVAATAILDATQQTAELKVLGADDGGELALTYTWLAQGPSEVVFAVNGSHASAGSTAFFSAPGNYQITVHITDVGGKSATSVVTVVVDQVLTTLTVVPALVQVTPGGAARFIAQLQDQFGGSMSGTPAWTMDGGGQIGADGLFIAGPVVVEPQTVTATLAGRTGSAQVQITNQSAVGPGIIIPPAADSTPVTGTSSVLTVFGSWPGGESMLNYTWSASGPALVTFTENGTNAAKRTVATFRMPGIYQFQVVVVEPTGLASVVSLSVEVVPIIAALTIQPASVKVLAGATQTFTAAGRDQFNQSIVPALAWSVSGGGTIDGTGVFTAAFTAGSGFLVTAGAGGIRQTATVTVFLPVNQPPQVVAGPDLVLDRPGSGALAGAVQDDGLPRGKVLSVAWRQISGPATAIIADATQPTTTATFPAAGTYGFTLTAQDGEATTTAMLTVRVNAPPQVSLPGQFQVQFPGTLPLSAVITDDGLPLGSQVSVAWTLVDGPGKVDFLNSSAAATSATFFTPGVYHVDVTAWDGAGQSSARSQIVVWPNPATNTAPQIKTQGTSRVRVSDTPMLRATIQDMDPIPGMAVSTQWVQVAGPAPVQFTDPTSTMTAIRFTAPGQYTVRLLASDGQKVGTSDLVIDVLAPDAEPIDGNGGGGGGCGGGSITALILLAAFTALRRRS